MTSYPPPPPVAPRPPVGRPGPQLSHRWAPAWAQILAWLSLVPVVLVGGYGIRMVVEDAQRPPTGSAYDGLNGFFGILLVVAAVLLGVWAPAFLIWKRKWLFITFASVWLGYVIMPMLYWMLTGGR